jgi:small subunit ribosomal protein S18
MAIDKRQKRRRPGGPDTRRKRRTCQFCDDKSATIDYKDTGLLRKYVSDRGKIRSRRVTGACSIHQRRVAQAIKNAREMALLPYLQNRG